MLDEAQGAVVPSAERTYYAGEIYWNNFPAVAEHLNRLITGYPDKNFVSYLLDHHRPVDRAFILNCGNGWVEREMFARGAVRSVTGSDISTELVQDARQEAAKIGMPAEYLIADVNRLDLTGREFQWVVNYAALHHVAYIDHVVRQIWLSLPQDGLLINYDYVGPHRNQYDWESWSTVVRIWEGLPRHLRPRLDYPHVPTMLSIDPTEAVHSELIVKTLQRYFDIIYSAPLGGAVAYHLLFQARALYEQRDSPSGRAIVDSIIRDDVRYTNSQISRSLFAFIVCRPKAISSISAQMLDTWAFEEIERENRAHQNGGRYYPKTELEIITYDLRGT
jgi:SAM-dependent methyltransferase